MMIKKRLAISNILMLLAPVIITAVIGLACIGVIWFTIAQGTGVGFEDSEDFSQASTGIAKMVQEALDHTQQSEQLTSLAKLTSFLQRGAMSLVITEDGHEFYRYGSASSPEDTQLAKAALSVGSSATITSGTENLHTQTYLSQGRQYIIYVYNSDNTLSYSNLKAVLVITGCILLLTIVLSVWLTDRFLTRFMFRHIEEPLTKLSDGVHQIRDGHLDYRLNYEEADEFLPVCEDFNDMASRLKESVERSRREEESRKQLMAGISHDLRSPLTCIQAYVEGLLDGVATTEQVQQKYLSTIKRKAEELEQMVSRILSYSKLEIENSARSPEPLQLDEILNSELDALSPDYAQRGLSITSKLEACTVVADPAELHSILINIADNSLKYKTTLYASLHISLKADEENCLLCFMDDGPGVPEEAIAQLFNVFYRADPARSNGVKGCGLGLSIVEKTVSQMGGRIWAENRANKDCHHKNIHHHGLCIYITLPNGKAL